MGTQEDGDWHVSGLRMSNVPVIMLDRHEDIPKSVRFPIEDVTKIVGKTALGHPYLESSIAYMAGQAILELVPGDKLGIWGVDLHCDSEYAYQRPNMEYLIGLARGRGIKVYIPPQSALLTNQAGVAYGHWSTTEKEKPWYRPL